MALVASGSLALDLLVTRRFDLAGAVKSISADPLPGDISVMLALPVKAPARPRRFCPFAPQHVLTRPIRGGNVRCSKRLPARNTIEPPDM